jgi:hypothetical protein
MTGPAQTLYLGMFGLGRLLFLEITGPAELFLE